MKQPIHPFLTAILLTLTLLCSSCGHGQSSQEATLPARDSLELPAFDSLDDIIRHIGYTASYNHQTLVPNWVAYELTREEAEGNCNLQRNFSRDPSVAYPKASREDYSNSGWDKGHMAARAVMKWSNRALMESDYFTNICPQDHQLNAGLWNRIESLARRAAKRYGSVYIITGPIFDSVAYGTIGQAGVCVPDGFFKALLVNDNGQYKGISFSVPNRPCSGSIAQYAMTIDSLEAILGRDLFALLPDPSAEASYQMSDWK